MAAVRFSGPFVIRRRWSMRCPNCSVRWKLLLKARLAEVDPSSHARRLNNPEVLSRLKKAGVQFSANESETVSKLRSLRNELQHGESRFKYRSALSVCKDSVLLIDRFAIDELGLWLGDVIQSEEWRHLLRFDALRERAHTVVSKRMTDLRASAATAEVSVCPECGTECLVRPTPNDLQRCLFCDHVPRVVFDEDLPLPEGWPLR